MNLRQNAVSHALASILLIGLTGVLLFSGYISEQIGYHWMIPHAIYGIGITVVILGMIGMYGLCNSNKGHFILLGLALNGALFVGEMILLAPLFATSASSSLEAGMFSLFSLAVTAVICFAVNKFLVDQLLHRLFQPKMQVGYIDHYLG